MFLCLILQSEHNKYLTLHKSLKSCQKKRQHHFASLPAWLPSSSLSPSTTSSSSTTLISSIWASLNGFATFHRFYVYANDLARGRLTTPFRLASFSAIGSHCENLTSGISFRRKVGKREKGERGAGSGERKQGIDNTGHLGNPCKLHGQEQRSIGKSLAQFSLALADAAVFDFPNELH